MKTSVSFRFLQVPPLRVTAKAVESSLNFSISQYLVPRHIQVLRGLEGPLERARKGHGTKNTKLLSRQKHVPLLSEKNMNVFFFFFFGTTAPNVAVFRSCSTPGQDPKPRAGEENDLKS